MGNVSDLVERRSAMIAVLLSRGTICPSVVSGPVLLFELCDLGPLRDWLTAQDNVTEDFVDKTITFSLHIARGMQHLHSHQVITTAAIWSYHYVISICRIV